MPPRFEYYVSGGDVVYGDQRQMNDLSESGWRLVTAQYVPETKPGGHVLLGLTCLWEREIRVTQPVTDP